MKDLLEFLGKLREKTGNPCIGWYELKKICEKDEETLSTVCNILFECESDIKHIKKFF